ncbi:MAG TPA: nicotinate-nucleotide--dimethylbenzimidazole phosphoribosyltransferase, partial [Longimicrobiaceae bacterium]|nr:nicotinate-nucleotide--dimethylbenzimidazole phosphoribosyltransferase [Longimicrobiaceae bacterium]
MSDGRVPRPEGEFAPAAKQAVYDAIALRRDVRAFRPDPVPDETLVRILGAAHRAGSVGFMQPWDFVVVRSPERKAGVYELFRRANERAATRWEGDRRARYAALKLQGILDAPLCVCVTCDTRRGGPHVLGRDTIRETDVYSTCLAVQNLWLAARAEGVGVGWVSIVDNAELSAALRLPAGVIPVAFLCVGYPVEFPETPMLEATGWRGRLPLAELVRFDDWEGDGAGDPLQALLGGARRGPEPADGATADPPRTVEELVGRVPEVDPAGERAACVRERLDALTKPRGSLGRLEELAVHLARVQGTDHPVAERKRVLVFAGDHGVCAEGVSAYRPEVTARLCYNFVAGGGAINALARRAGAQVVVVDVGVDHDFGRATGIVHAKVRRGTRNLAAEPALTRAEAERALLAGAAAVLEAPPCDVLALGEVGIGNTTSAAALLALLLGARAQEVVGAGTGVGSGTLRRKAAAVERMLARCAGRDLDPLDALAEAGGCETAALAGAVLAAASLRVPVLLDGFITGVAALAAVRLAPAARDALVASHRSAERGHSLALESLGLRP